MDVTRGTTSKSAGVQKSSISKGEAPGAKSSTTKTKASSSTAYQPQHGVHNFDLLSSIMATAGVQGVQAFVAGFPDQAAIAGSLIPNGILSSDYAAQYAKLTAHMMAYQAAQNQASGSQPSTSIKPESLTSPTFYVPNLAAHAAKARAAASKEMDPQHLARAKEEAEMQAVLVEGDEEGGMVHGETYDQYKPAKLSLGLPHPDPIVETLSLASVQPPDITYDLELPNSIASEGLLSSLQLEAIVYACQRHERFLEKPADGGPPPRAGYLIGDGAGVGKGRTIAGIILENWLLGRKKSVWLSVSNDLKYDAIRDLEDIGARIDVNLLSKAKYGSKLNSSENGNIRNGVIFVTYPALVGESQSPRQEFGTRMKQLMKWCGNNFDGCLIFDECHRAKNLCPAGGTKPTKTGLAVLEIQRLLPKARVVYASATGASEPRNMAYMTRLGIWGPQTPFKDFAEFHSSIEKRGVSAMEIIAMDMKLRGGYIARQLSFAGVTFEIGEVPMEEHAKRLFNDCVDLWNFAREKFAAAAELFNADARLKKYMWGQFWGAHQRFFKYLCLSAKVKATVKIAKEAIKNGKCAVIGLQSTGEARTLECLDENNGVLNDFVSTSRAVFQSLVDKHFPAFDRRKTMALAGLADGLEQEAEAALNEEPDEVDSVTGRTKRKVTKLVTSYKVPTLSDLEDSDSDTSSEESEPRPSAPSSRVTQKRKSVSQPKNGRPKKKKQRGHDSDASVSGSDSSFALSGSDSDSDSMEDDGDNSSESDARGSDDSNCSDEEELSKPNPWLKMIAAKEKAKKLRKKVKDDEMAEEDITVDTNAEKSPTKSRAELRDESRRMKEDLLNRFDELSSRLPPNTLDDLIDQLGGPTVVAEMTGRKGRVVATNSGSVEYEARNENDVALELLNLAEKQRFMDGGKLIAIISEAASSGISLQADRRAVNQRRRVHITLELSWSADKAIQQFGRTHRSNQVSAPEYMFLITDLAGEKRFAAAVARRLECLGALTHGDRRATDSRDLSMFNIDTKYGRQAVDKACKYAAGVIPGIPKNLLPPFKGGEKAFVQHAQRAMISVGMLVPESPGSTQYSLDKNAVSIGTFLNRILGMKVEMQNSIFELFVRTMDALVDIAKREGKFEMGVVELGFGSSDVSVDKKLTFIGCLPWTKAPTVLYAISVERGLSWENAVKVLNEHDDKHSGFYLSYHEMAGKHTICLAVRKSDQLLSSTSRNRQLYCVYRPNSGMQLRMDPLEEIGRKGRLVTLDAAVKCWKGMYDSMARRCVHAYWAGNCKNTTAGLQCDIGLRRKTYMVLSGSILSVWHEVGKVLYNEYSNSTKRVQNVRVRLQNDKRVVGIIVPNAAVEALITNLRNGGWKMSEDAILSTLSRLSDDSDSDDSSRLTDDD